MPFCQNLAGELFYFGARLPPEQMFVCSGLSTGNLSNEEPFPADELEQHSKGSVIDESQAEFVCLLVGFVLNTPDGFQPKTKRSELVRTSPRDVQKMHRTCFTYNDAGVKVYHVVVPYSRNHEFQYFALVKSTTHENTCRAKLVQEDRIFFVPDFCLEYHLPDPSGLRKVYTDKPVQSVQDQIQDVIASITLATPDLILNQRASSKRRKVSNLDSSLEVESEESCERTESTESVDSVGIPNDQVSSETDLDLVTLKGESTFVDLVQTAFCSALSNHDGLRTEWLQLGLTQVSNRIAARNRPTQATIQKLFEGLEITESEAANIAACLIPQLWPDLKDLSFTREMIVQLSKAIQHRQECIRWGTCGRCLLVFWYRACQADKQKGAETSAAPNLAEILLDVKMATGKQVSYKQIERCMEQPSTVLLDSIIIGLDGILTAAPNESILGVEGGANALRSAFETFANKHTPANANLLIQNVVNQVMHPIKNGDYGLKAQISHIIQELKRIRRAACIQLPESNGDGDAEMTESRETQSRA